ncbi:MULTISPECIES: serine protease [unclassified Massilia]|uniref:S1 family peptidase n=1 Tax=unclassified Massilia TaxID=2609279 RepID=UPI0015FFBDD0|nr:MULTISPECIES: serine protease [unclassified Massilia]QNB00190.1 trypsin-like peptidase domain-containing protein [Massilia sp. Se16.2.3]
MRSYLLAFGLMLGLPQAVSAQTGDDWMLNQRDKDVIGIVEVRVGAKGSPLDAVDPERGTGTLISAAGHVLTAAHLFTDKSYAVCASAAGADPNKACRIDFYWRGDPANRFSLTISGPRQADRDYIVLGLPSAAEKIGRPGWPFATLARKASDNEPVYAAGYRGSDAVQPGSANTIDTARGVLRADMASGRCSNAYGISRNATMQTSPGLSGAPTFNRLHRVVGIVLGEACAADDGGNAQDAPKSRILLVQDMERLCASPALSCFFGFDGDIDPARADDTTPWYKRLIGGEAVADNYAYGLKIREIAKFQNLLGFCSLLASDAQLVRSVQADAEAGGELAIVFDTVWAVCRPGANLIDSLPSRQRLQRLADAGYEPAQQLAAMLVLFELGPKLASRRSPEDPVQISQSERVSLRRAEAYLRSAAAHEWSAASMTMFDLCRTRVFSCPRRETDAYLDAAVADGQRDALRMAGILFLVGNEPALTRRYGVSRPQNTERALALFGQAATPQTGTTNNPGYMAYDNYSAGYLGYFSWGGMYRGRTLMPTNVLVAQQYNGGCNSNGPAVPPLFEYCTMINEVGRFNNLTDRTMRRAAWSTIQQLAQWAPIAGPLGKNLATWSPDGSGIDRIDCPLNDELVFAAPTVVPAFRPRTAYCYFANPQVE